MSGNSIVFGEEKRIFKYARYLEHWFVIFIF